MPEEFPSYPKVYRLGHRDIEGILDGDIVVQEKVDGSQINWYWDNKEQLHVRSKGQYQYGGPQGREKPDDIFKPAIMHLLSQVPLDAGTGNFFRGETLAKKKHNTLEYKIVPQGHIVLFDITTVGWRNTPHWELRDYAESYNLDVAAPLYEGTGKFFDASRFLTLASVLGGPIEGIVIKNFSKFTADGKPMMAKVVREEFRELHEKSWKADHPKRAEIVEHIIASLSTEARYEKAVQHLAEQGLLVNAEQDIGKLIDEVRKDTIDEETDWITQKLVEHFMPQVKRGLARGIPEWYKARLNKEREANNG